MQIALLYRLKLTWECYVSAYSCQDGVDELDWLPLCLNVSI